MHGRLNIKEHAQSGLLTVDLGLLVNLTLDECNLLFDLLFLCHESLGVIGGEVLNVELLVSGAFCSLHDLCLSQLKSLQLSVFACLQLLILFLFVFIGLLELLLLLDILEVLLFKTKQYFL